MMTKFRTTILAAFTVVSLVSVYFISTITFSFDFEQFFPEGDEDLEFFRNFTAEFETDDNFLLIGIPSDGTIFDSAYLNKVHRLSLSLRDAPYVKNVQSITTMRYPVKTPFGISTIPVIHINDPSRFPTDSIRLMSDDRYIGNLVNETADAVSIFIKVQDSLDVYQSGQLIDDIKQKISREAFGEYHLLGRANFQTELIKIQQREVFVSAIFSILLISFILFVIFRKMAGVLIALVSITMSLIIFLGIMGLLGKPLSIMSALYPVLMLIVSTSDVVHLMSKYVDELNKGKDRVLAIKTTIQQIGMATFLTSFTTAIGFTTLLTSRLYPVREFGLNSAVGVLTAFVTTIFVAPALLSFFSKDQIIRSKEETHWFGAGFMQRCRKITFSRPRQVVIGFSLFVLVCLYGISLVSTNYRIEHNLPTNHKITEDYLYFEREFSGFRPLEFAILCKEGYTADDYEVVREIDKLETRLKESGLVNSILSQATLYKSISRMNAGNTNEAYVFPKDKETFEKSKQLLRKSNAGESIVLINEANDKTRISSKIVDIGADSIKMFGLELEEWISENIDGNVIEIKRTGTGLIIDKNSVYVTESLIKGLGLALVIISIVMAILLKNWKMLILAFIANSIPVLFGGALLGYLGIDLEAGISIVFAVIFGIAVDDTIHFLSKYKLCRDAGMTVDQSIGTTFDETGKAIFFTTVILFLGFLVMLFSSSPPTKTVGVLISVTLITALLSDVLLLPVLMRRWLKERE